jgi:RNA polymerase sigma-70 factor, ECF subfamily
MRLFLAHQRRFYGLILSLVPHVADADDLLQETAALMWQKFAEFRSGTDFAAWGLRFARNVVFNYHKKKRRLAGRVTFSDELLASVTDEVAEVLDEIDVRHAALRRCLTKLPEQGRRLIELRYEPDATCKGVAERLGKSVESVYKALGRAHDALLRCVERTIAAEGRP